MKIGTKLIVYLSVPLIALMLLFGYLGQRASQTRLHQEMEREGRGIALTMRMALEDYLRDRQLEDIRELVERVSDYERVYGIRVFGPRGDLLCQSSSLNRVPFTDLRDRHRAETNRLEVESHRILNGRPVLSFFFPLISTSGELIGSAQLLQLESYIDEESQASRNFLTALTAVMILAAGIVILLVTRLGVSRPIEELVHSFREVGTGETVALIPVHRGDEFGRLAREFNTMCRRLETAQASLEAEQAERRRVEARLRNAQRLASIGRLSAGLAHEIGTPLNVIGGRAETLRRKLAGNPIADRNLGIIVTQIERIARIVRGMLDFARAREPRPIRLDLEPVVRRVLEFLGQRIEEGGVQVESSFPESLPPVWADPDQIYEVFLNLVTNALDAMPKGGVLRVGGSLTEGAPPARPAGASAPFVAVAVEDNGIGIRPEHLDRIFDPFFTTKEIGKGTGLGLSVTYGIVQEHGGWIEVVSRVGSGTSLRVHFPVAEAEALPPAASGGAS